MFIVILLIIIIIVLFFGFAFYAIGYGMDNKFSKCDEEMFRNCNELPPVDSPQDESDSQ